MLFRESKKLCTVSDMFSRVSDRLLELSYFIDWIYSILFYLFIFSLSYLKFQMSGNGAFKKYVKRTNKKSNSLNARLVLPASTIHLRVKLKIKSDLCIFNSQNKTCITFGFRFLYLSSNLNFRCLKNKNYLIIIHKISTTFYNKLHNYYFRQI